MNHTIFNILLMSLLSMFPMQCKADPIEELLSVRYSGYAFDPQKPVSTEQLKKIIKAGQMTPSSFNDQPWYFIICDRTTDVESYNKLLHTLVPFNQHWAQHAPLLIVAIASTNSHHNQPNKWAEYDTGAAAFSMVMQATSLGLMSHQMGGFDAKALTTAFNIPQDCIPMAVIAIGYPAESETLLTAKQRKDPTENFFMGTWGNI